MFEVLVLILLEILFIFQDNEAIFKDGFYLEAFFLKNHYAEVLQGGVFFVPNLFFNDNAQLKFGGMQFFFFFFFAF